MATIKEEILSLKPHTNEVLSLTSTMDLVRLENGISITRYFKLYGNPRSWAIEGSRQVSDWDKVMSVVKDLKAEINETRKYINLRDGCCMHGITIYV